MADTVPTTFVLGVYPDLTTYLEGPSLFSTCSRASFSPRTSLSVEFSPWFKSDTTKALSNTLSRGYERVTKQSLCRQTTVIIVKRVTERGWTKERETERERDGASRINVYNKVRGGERCVIQKYIETPITMSLRTHRRDDWLGSLVRFLLAVTNRGSTMLAAAVFCASLGRKKEPARRDAKAPREIFSERKRCHLKVIAVFCWIHIISNDDLCPLDKYVHEKHVHPHFKQV